MTGTKNKRHSNTGLLQDYPDSRGGSQTHPSLRSENDTHQPGCSHATFPTHFEGNQGTASDSVTFRTKIGHWDLADHERKKFEVVTWMDERDVPFLNWDNGPGPSDYWMRDICKEYHTDIEFRGKQGSHAWHVIGKDLVPGRIVSDVWKGPVVRLHDFRMIGPLPYTYGTKAQNVFLDGKNDLSEVDLSLAFSRFARRAFRKPISQKDIEPYLEIEKNARMKLGRNQEEAFFLALKAMLVSPDFLYIREENQNRRGLTTLKLPTVCPIFCGLPFPTMIFLFWQRMKNCRIGKSSSNRQFDYSMMIAIGRLWKALLIAGYAWISSGPCRLPP